MIFYISSNMKIIDIDNQISIQRLKNFTKNTAMCKFCKGSPRSRFGVPAVFLHCFFFEHLIQLIVPDYVIQYHFKTASKYFKARYYTWPKSYQVSEIFWPTQHKASVSYLCIKLSKVNLFAHTNINIVAHDIGKSFYCGCEPEVFCKAGR